MLAKIITFWAVAVLATIVAAVDTPTPRLTLSNCPSWVPECKSNSAFPFFTPAPTPTGDVFPTTANRFAPPVNDEYVIAGRAVDVENRADSILILEPTVIEEGGESVTIYHSLSFPVTVTQTVFLSSAETPGASESVASVSNSGYPSASESETTTSSTTTSVTSTTWQTQTTSVPASGSWTPGASTTTPETATTSSASLSETPTTPTGPSSVPSEVTSWATETSSASTLVTATSSPTTASASHSSSTSGTASDSSSSGTPSHPSASATASSQASSGRVAKAGGAVLAGLGGMIVLLG
ncbi:hypothetical protein CONLIGDRAFT_678774 [Coniochaeta ligniaria NRRL 30616]|uniref:Uncharacterized protein n=1 Tax=Coniochaeta ligniaria NRRL 30616 TaxID=1408157 RepID=A0A1J7JSN7_9PEZI|nr:hypothetical protein CONLIGDRAFT_678774 [Coniochaeta ligniaria NRRL 30616]